MANKRRKLSKSDTLDDLRVAIDDLDRRLLEILNQRIECARKIGELKASKGSPVYVAPREKQVLERLLRRNTGPFPNENLLRIYREVIAASRGAEEALRVSYAGTIGSLGHAAATGIFGRSTELLPESSPGEALARVARKDVNYAVLPSVVAPEGVDEYALLHILKLELYLVAEYRLALDVGIALPPRRKAIRKVLVPPAFSALASERLALHAPSATVELVKDIPTAAMRAKQERQVAALIPRFTADEFGLEMKTTMLGPGESRTVRYLVVARQPASSTGADKTTVAFGLINRAGNLLRALKPFSDRRINLDLLTASPAGVGSREDLFFLDFVGHISNEKIEATLQEMREVCSFVNVLGSYPVFDLSSRSSLPNT